MTEIVLASDDPDFENLVRGAFANDLNGQLRRHDELDTDALLREDPAVVVLGPSWSSDDLVAVAGEIDSLRPEISVILVAEPSADLWERALRSGARDLVAPDADASDVHDAIERARERVIRQRQNVRAEVDAASSIEAGGFRAQVLVVASPKGGSGKTMLATSLAYGLAEDSQGSVVLVDLDLQFPDVATALRLTPEYSMAHAAASSNDPVHVKSFLTAHSAGFWALCGPSSPVTADEIDPKDVRHVIETLCDEFDWVILDTGAGIDEHTLNALDIASEVLMVTTTDVASIHSIRKMVEVLDQLGADPARQRLVLNRSNARVGLSADDIERTVGREVAVRVPSSRLVPTAMNQGSAVLEDSGRSNVGRAIHELLGTLERARAGSEAAAPRRGLFRGGRS